MLSSLFSYVQDAKKEQRRAFLERQRHPVLVLEPFKVLADTDLRFETVASGEARDSVTTVAELAKRPGANAFAQMITIGRALNNDVVIAGGCVSKFHAYVQIGAKTSLVDARATYGTFVRGEKLEPGARVELRSGDSIKLGAVSGVFLEPSAFWEYLQGVVSNPSCVQL